MCYLAVGIGVKGVKGTHGVGPGEGGKQLAADLVDTRLVQTYLTQKFTGKLVSGIISASDHQRLVGGKRGSHWGHCGHHPY